MSQEEGKNIWNFTAAAEFLSLLKMRHFKSSEGIKVPGKEQEFILEPQLRTSFSALKTMKKSSKSFKFLHKKSLRFESWHFAQIKTFYCPAPLIFREIIWGLKYSGRSEAR